MAKEVYQPKKSFFEKLFLLRLFKRTKHMILFLALVCLWWLSKCIRYLLLFFFFSLLVFSLQQLVFLLYFFSVLFIFISFVFTFHIIKHHTVFLMSHRCLGFLLFFKVLFALTRNFSRSSELQKEMLRNVLNL